jgi:glutathione-regulated potassium-efflux system ancillary protein KefC
MHATWITTALVYLAAAVIAVPIARRLGLGAIIGYLAAGWAIGPWALGIISDPAQIVDLGEFGVVLMLFLVGLELEPRRLWSLRRPIFGWGSVQLLVSAALVAGVAVLVDGGGNDGVRIAIVAGAALAMSSTAIGLAVLGERHVTTTTAGQAILSVSLFQDIAAIPLLALIPLLAPEAKPGMDHHAVQSALKGLGMIAVIVLGGRLLLRPALRWIARSQTPEIFTAASLALVAGTAALMEAVHLSMALGAFLAGVLLAESEYRRELETDLEPFKGLLLGLFFIAVGMGIDVPVVLSYPLVIAGIVAAFLAVKAAVLWAIARRLPVPRPERPVFIILLAQGGEFGFVVLQAARGQDALPGTVAAVLTAAITLSMLLSPLLLVLADRFWIPRLAECRPDRPKLDEIAEPQDAPVIVAGFGRYGQIIGRMLYANGLDATVLEYDAEQVEAVRRFGFRVFYGDATRLDLLRIAGAERARVLVVAVDSIDASLELVDLAREHFPDLQIVARARNVQHWYQLNERGVQYIERETLDAALMSARSVLELLGMEPHRARTLAMRFRRHSIEQLHAMAPHFRDESKMISLAKTGRQQLEQLFAQERGRRAAEGPGAWSAGGLRAGAATAFPSDDQDDRPMPESLASGEPLPPTPEPGIDPGAPSPGFAPPPSAQV